MFFCPWAKSILGDDTNPVIFWCENKDAIEAAITLQRNGFSFFFMKYSFFYDVFYLLHDSILDKFIEEKAYNYLNNICGFMTKGALQKVYEYWKIGGTLPVKVDSALINHKKINDKIFTQQEKKVLVVANVSAGKSTLINALVGCRFNRTKTTACTNKLVYIHNKCYKDGLAAKLVDDSYCYFDDLTETDSEYIKEVAFPFNSTLAGQPICFIDTPGVNNAEDINHCQITECAIKNDSYDLVIYVSNGLYFGTDDEYNLLRFLKANVKKPIIFVLNQLDNFIPEEDSIVKMLKDYYSDLIKFGFKNPTIVPLSAYASFLFRLGSSCTSKTEERRKNSFKELFKEEYYDFPAYLEQKKSKDIITKTGIKMLENKIITSVILYNEKR